MSLRVVVIAPSLSMYRTLAGEIKGAGHLPVSTWDSGRKNLPAELSSEELTELATDTAELIQQADAIVSFHDRLASGSSRGSAFFAGFAYGQGIPVVVVGPFEEVGLFSRRIINAPMYGLRSALAGVEKLKQAQISALERGGAEVKMGVPQQSSTPSVPEQGVTNGLNPDNSGDPSGSRPERDPGSEGSGIAGGDGSHI